MGIKEKFTKWKEEKLKERAEKQAYEKEAKPKLETYRREQEYESRKRKIKARYAPPSARPAGSKPKKRLSFVEGFSPIQGFGGGIMGSRGSAGGFNPITGQSYGGASKSVDRIKKRVRKKKRKRIHQAPAQTPSAPRFNPLGF